MLKTTVGKLRFAGYFEGISLLILLFIAMPMKYWFGIPEAVRIVGSIHGALFITYCVVIAYVTLKTRWNLIWPILAVIVAFIPFGNFILDKKLHQLEKVHG